MSGFEFLGVETPLGTVRFPVPPGCCVTAGLCRGTEYGCNVEISSRFLDGGWTSHVYYISQLEDGTPFISAHGPPQPSRSEPLKAKTFDEWIESTAALLEECAEKKQ